MTRIVQFGDRYIIQINIRHNKIFFEQLASRNYLPGLIRDQAAAVENQAILSAD